MNNVCILDYGSGNTKSVYNLFASIQPKVTISNSIQNIEDASHIVLPGVGSFGASLSKILETIPMEALTKALFIDKKPFLGICVGMQVLAEVGHEFELNKGLGWIAGEISKIKCNNLPLPHVGWNSIRKTKDSKLFHGIEDGSDFYFVHSYAFTPVNSDFVLSTTIYGETFCSAIEKENIHGVQFHPEKSHVAGKKLISNFLDM